MDATMFVRELVKAYEVNYNLSAKQSLALEISNLSSFEISSRARFLTLVSAVECLCDREARSDTAIQHIRSLTETTSKAELAEGEKQSLLNGLGNLQRESISKSARNLVKKLLGKEAMGLFHTCYEVRSRMLHDGSLADEIEIGSLVNELKDLVTDLLLVDITGMKRTRA